MGLGWEGVGSARLVYGQVPQTGWGDVQDEASVLKSVGSEVIKLTHQLLRSWLKDSAS